MASQLAVEGTATHNEIQQWLFQNKIDVKYAEAFDALAIKSADDLKLITTQEEFQGLIDEISNYLKTKNMSLPFMDGLKLKKAWKALVPVNQNTSTQIIPMGPKERESLELLAKYMQFVQKEMIKLDEFLNGAVLEAYCNDIRKESKALQQSIIKREKELIQQTQSKYNDLKNEYKTKQKHLETLALTMNDIKKKCDNALQMNEYDQLEQRRSIICDNVKSVKQTVNDAMSQNIECSMKRLKLDLINNKMLHNKIHSFGNVYVHHPFDVVIKSVTAKYIDGDAYDIEMKVDNIGTKTYKQCEAACVSKGGTLATKQQVLDYLKKAVGGDVWTPVAGDNDWLQIGGDWPYGKLHTEIANGIHGKPNWGNVVGNQGFKETFYCAIKKTIALKVSLNITNGEYLEQNKTNLSVSLMKCDDDVKEQMNDGNREDIISVIATHRVQCNILKKNHVELQLKANVLQETCILLVRLEVLNRIFEKKYKWKKSKCVLEAI